MPLSNFVVRDAIVPALTAGDKEGAIREMVRSLHAAGYFQTGDVDDIVKAVMRREQLGTTGIGRNIAIPHSRHPAVDRLIGALALSQPGVPFDSLDGEPVHVLVLLISPQDRPGEHLRALETVVRTMRDEAFVKALRACTTRDEVWALLDGAQAGW
jgi:mannitol/fructose-specific phosphotransferase system IIA component (Ntr-type)